MKRIIRDVKNLPIRDITIGIFTIILLNMHLFRHLYVRTDRQRQQVGAIFITESILK